MPRNLRNRTPRTKRPAFSAALAALVTLACAFALCGCQVSFPGTSEPAEEHVYGMPAELDPNASSAEEDTPAVQTKQVTFPASYFVSLGATNPGACLAGLGYTGIVEHEDGSYTATVPVEAYAELVETVYQTTKNTIDALVGSEKYPNVAAVDYDEQFATVTVLFTGTEVSAEEALVAHVPGEAAVLYQTVAGLPVGCDVILVGADGSELASTMFPA